MTSLILSLSHHHLSLFLICSPKYALHPCVYVQHTYDLAFEIRVFQKGRFQFPSFTFSDSQGHQFCYKGKLPYISCEQFESCANIFYSVFSSAYMYFFKSHQQLCFVPCSFHFYAKMTQLNQNKLCQFNSLLSSIQTQ